MNFEIIRTKTIDELTKAEMYSLMNYHKIRKPFGFKMITSVKDTRVHLDIEYRKLFPNHPETIDGKLIFEPFNPVQPFQKNAKFV